MIKRLLLVTVPAVITVFVAMGIGVEAWVRLRWNERGGTPGFFVSDPVRGEKLAADYSGWFAGVPVRINRLGFRDTRDYALEKSPSTFRILVLGDSVTFGHGSIDERTWPYLFEQQLKAWKPHVDWQVWNLGVPGYNTSQEFAYLLEVEHRFEPDMVIVGFFGNDMVDNQPIAAPTRAARLTSDLKSFLRRHVYSWEWYRKQYLRARGRFARSSTERELLENLAEQEQLLVRPATVAQLEAQTITNPAPLTADEIAREPCRAPARTFSLAALQETPGFAAWLRAVDEFHRLQRERSYPIVFFINDAPARCVGQDLFDPRPTKALDDYLLSVLGRGAFAVSSHDAFVRFRPSAMPGAGAHSLGNANVVKADVLFRFVSAHVVSR
jgi:lysophospholipase L1-like esterase